MNKEEINELIKSNIDYYFEKANQNGKKTKYSLKGNIRKYAPFYFSMAILVWIVYYLFKFVQGLGL